MVMRFYSLREETSFSLLFFFSFGVINNSKVEWRFIYYRDLWFSRFATFKHHFSFEWKQSEKIEFSRQFDSRVNMMTKKSSRVRGKNGGMRYRRRHENSTTKRATEQTKNVAQLYSIYIHAMSRRAKARSMSHRHVRHIHTKCTRAFTHNFVASPVPCSMCACAIHPLVVLILPGTANPCYKVLIVTFGWLHSFYKWYWVRCASYESVATQACYSSWESEHRKKYPRQQKQ